MRTIVLLGELKATQHIYGLVFTGGLPRRYMRTKGRAAQEQYQWEARAQWRDRLFKATYFMHVTLCFGTKRRSDWDTFHKLSCDASIAYGDDSQIRQATVALACDKQKPPQ